MQHWAQQLDTIHTRKWNFDQNWYNVQNALSKENKERADDIEVAKHKLQNKIINLKEVQAKKISVLKDNTNTLKKSSEQLDKNTSMLIERADEYQSEHQNKCEDFVCQYLDNAQQFSQKITNYARNKCNEVQKKIVAVDQSIKKKSQQEMRQLKQLSILHIENMIKIECGNQKTHIQNLSNLVFSSLKNMRQTLKDYDKQFKKSETKLENDIQKLQNEMSSLIFKQKQQGDITYDCLLKLVEDSYGKIQQIKMK